MASLLEYYRLGEYLHLRKLRVPSSERKDAAVSPPSSGRETAAVATTAAVVRGDQEEEEKRTGDDSIVDRFEDASEPLSSVFEGLLRKMGMLPSLRPANPC